MLVKVGGESGSPLAAPAPGRGGDGCWDRVKGKPRAAGSEPDCGEMGLCWGVGGRRSVVTPCCAHPLCRHHPLCSEGLLFFLLEPRGQRELQQELTDFM